MLEVLFDIVAITPRPNLKFKRASRAFVPQHTMPARLTRFPELVSFFFAPRAFRTRNGYDFFYFHLLLFVFLRHGQRSIGIENRLATAEAYIAVGCCPSPPAIHAQPVAGLPELR